MEPLESRCLFAGLAGFVETTGFMETTGFFGLPEPDDGAVFSRGSAGGEIRGATGCPGCDGDRGDRRFATRGVVEVVEVVEITMVRPVVIGRTSSGGGAYGGASFEPAGVIWWLELSTFSIGAVGGRSLGSDAGSVLPVRGVGTSSREAFDSRSLDMGEGEPPDEPPVAIGGGSSSGLSGSIGSGAVPAVNGGSRGPSRSNGGAIGGGSATLGASGGASVRDAFDAPRAGLTNGLTNGAFVPVGGVGGGDNGGAGPSSLATLSPRTIERLFGADALAGADAAERDERDAAVERRGLEVDAIESPFRRGDALLVDEERRWSEQGGGERTEDDEVAEEVGRLEGRIDELSADERLSMQGVEAARRTLRRDAGRRTGAEGAGAEGNRVDGGERSTAAERVDPRRGRSTAPADRTAVGAERAAARVDGEAIDRLLARLQDRRTFQRASALAIFEGTRSEADDDGLIELLAADRATLTVGSRTDAGNSAPRGESTRRADGVRTAADDAPAATPAGATLTTTASRGANGPSPSSSTQVTIRAATSTSAP